MTMHHIIELAVTVAVIYALAISLSGVTFVLMDLFLDWYLPFKKARKDKAAKDAKQGKE